MESTLLRQELSVARRKQTGLFILRMAFAFLGISSFFLLLVLHLFEAAGPGAFAGVLPPLLAALLFIAFLFSFRTLFHLWRADAVTFAKALESAEKLPEGLFSNALELSRSLQPGASKVLSDRYIDRTIHTLKGWQRRFVVRRRLGLALWSALFCIAVVVAIALLSRDRLSGWSSLWKGYASQIETVVTRPAELQSGVTVGNISVVCVPPAYSGLPEKRELHTAGRVRALKGSRIEWSAEIDREVQRIVAKTAKGQLLTVVKKERAFTVSFTMTDDDALEIRQAADTGMGKLFFRDTLICDRDKKPTVDMSSRLPLNEVRKKEKIVLQCRASDDFGLRGLRVILIRDGREELFPVELTGKPRSFQKEVTVDLSRLALKDGEQALLVAEAEDNDAVSGYKKVRSAAIPLSVIDEAKVHEGVELKLKELEKRMIHLLADHLENPFVFQEPGYALMKKNSLFQSKTIDIVQLLALVVADMRLDDATSDELFQALEAFAPRFSMAAENRNRTAERVASGSIRDSSLIRAQEMELKELEEMILFMDDAQARQRVDNVTDLADEFTKRGKELAEKMKNMESDAKMAELAKEFAALQKDLMKLLENIKHPEKGGLPEEFLNADAMKQLPMDALSETMENIQKALQSGDAQKAMQEMAKLRDLLDQMASAVAGAQNEFQNEAYERKMSVMQNAMKELDKMIDRQAKLNNKMKEQLEKNPEALKNFLEKALAKMRERKGQQLSPSDFPSADLAEMMKQMAGEEGSILEKMQGLGEALQGMLDGMQGAPGGSTPGGEMQGALDGLGSSYNQMSRFHLPGGLPSAESGLYHMMNLREGLKQGMQSMRQQMGSGMKPGGMSQGQNRKRNGRSGTSFGDIELTPENQNGRLREKIKDAIKEQGPADFQDENRKYYETIGN